MVLLVESVQKLLTGTHLLTFRFWKKYICCEKWKQRQKQKTVIKINYFYFWASFIDNHCHNI